MTDAVPESRSGLRYKPDDRLPVALAFGLGLQVAVLSNLAFILVPTIVMRAAGASEDYLSWAVFGTAAICGAITILQSFRTGRLGSGHVLVMAQLAAKRPSFNICGVNCSRSNALRPRKIWWFRLCGTLQFGHLLNNFFQVDCKPVFWSAIALLLEKWHLSGSTRIAGVNRRGQLT